MSNKLKGVLFGTLASLGGVVLYLVLYLVLGLIAGLAGALMGFLFIIVYYKLNPDDYSKFPYVYSIILIVLEILVSELIAVLISKVAIEDYDVSTMDVLHDLLMGYLVSGIVYGFSLFSFIRKRNENRKMANNLNQYDDQNVDNQNLDVDNQNVDDQNVDNQNLDVDNQNLDVDNQNVDKQDFDEENEEDQNNNLKDE